MPSSLNKDITMHEPEITTITKYGIVYVEKHHAVFFLHIFFQPEVNLIGCELVFSLLLALWNC